MRKLGFKIIYLALILFGLSCCKPSAIDKPNEYFRYLANPKNGLVKTKSLAGIKYNLKYLPINYLAFNDLKGHVNTESEKDSLIDSYKNSLTFILNIGPAQGEDFDITRVGVANYEEFAQRIEAMAFEAQESIYLKIGGEELKPVIVKMENINAQDNSRNFIVVFSKQVGTEGRFKEDLCFSYNDNFFNTGTNKFIFESEDLNNLPDFKF